MKQRTILAEDDLLRQVEEIARQRGATVDAVVQDALRAYVAAHQPARRISFAGLGHSGSPPLDVSNGRDEEILASELDPAHGWAPPSALSMHQLSFWRND